MSDIDTKADVARWLLEHFAPIRSSQFPAWNQRVRDELGPATLPALIDLVLHGDDQIQMQAMVAARALGADVYQDAHPTGWFVRLPGETEPTLRLP